MDKKLTVPDCMSYFDYLRNELRFPMWQGWKGIKNRSGNIKYLLKIFNQDLLDLAIFNSNTKPGIPQVRIDTETFTKDM